MAVNFASGGAGWVSLRYFLSQLLEVNFCACRSIHEPLLITQKIWFSRQDSPNKKTANIWQLILHLVGLAGFEPATNRL
jgi:hypothetical protein